MRCSPPRFVSLFVALLIATPLCPTAFGKKPDKPGGGGGDSSTAPFMVIELPGVDIAYKVSHQNVEGTVTVAGGSGSNAAYAVVDVATRLVLDSGPLPVPGNVNSDAWDVNSSGTIVGSADALPMRWVPQGTGYGFDTLPLLAGDSSGSVGAVSESGEMVGTSNTASSSRAAYWNENATTVIDLNTYVAAGSDWTLVAANDINSGGQVVGVGVLDGASRGFVLDLISGQIDAVPLVAGSVENEAWQVNETGHVIGRANDGIVGGGPIPQGGWGFYWGGPGTEPQLLPSSEQGRGIARGINNLDELAGDSAINGAPLGNGDQFASLWTPDGNDSFLVTDLGDQISSKPEWYLRIGFGINDDLWIAGEGRKRQKGNYSWHGVLIAPTP